MSLIRAAKPTDFIPLLQPSRPILTTTRFADGRIDVAPFSWCIPVSANPPMLLLALATKPRRQRSLLNILREKQFVINLPGVELVDRLARASYFYPKGINKLQELDFKTAPAQVVGAPILCECRAHVECQLVQVIPTGDHTTLIADVVAASYDPDMFDDKMILRLDKAKPLLHLRHYSLPDLSGQTFNFFGAGAPCTFTIPFPIGGLDANGRPVADEED